MVLHGVHHLGIDEPRMIGFARALSACGVSVLTPELPDIRDYHIDANSIAVIGSSAQWLSQQTKDAGRRAWASASPADLRSSPPPSRSTLPALNSCWPSARRTPCTASRSTTATGQALRPDGTYDLLPPHEYGRARLEYEHLEDFVPPADEAALRSVLKAHLYEDPGAERAAMQALTPGAA